MIQGGSTGYKEGNSLQAKGEKHTRERERRESARRERNKRRQREGGKKERKKKRRKVGKQERNERRKHTCDCEGTHFKRGECNLKKGNAIQRGKMG